MQQLLLPSLIWQSWWWAASGVIYTLVFVFCNFWQALKSSWWKIKQCCLPILTYVSALFATLWGSLLAAGIAMTPARLKVRKGPQIKHPNPTECPPERGTENQHWSVCCIAFLLWILKVFLAWADVRFSQLSIAAWNALLRIAWDYSNSHSHASKMSIWLSNKKNNATWGLSHYLKSSSEGNGSPVLCTVILVIQLPQHFSKFLPVRHLLWKSKALAAPSLRLLFDSLSYVIADSYRGPAWWSPHSDCRHPQAQRQEGFTTRRRQLPPSYQNV